MPKSKGFKYNLTRKRTQKLKHKATLKFKKKFSKKKKTYKRKSGGSDSSNDYQTGLLHKELRRKTITSDNSSPDNIIPESTKIKSKSNFIIIPDSQGYELSEKNRKAFQRNYKIEKPITQENKESGLVHVYEGNTKKDARTNAIIGQKLRQKASSKKTSKPIHRSEKSYNWEALYDDDYGLKNLSIADSEKVKKLLELKNYDGRKKSKD